jgi:ketosteroid isomerase-like protein
MYDLAIAVRDALQRGDLVALTSRMAPDVRWGAPEQSVPTCQNRGQVLRWYEKAQSVGASAEVVDTHVLGRHLVLGLRVKGNPRSESPRTPSMRWQVLSIENGTIAEIRGYESRRDAVEFATAGVSSW